METKGLLDFFNLGIDLSRMVRIFTKQILQKLYSFSNSPPPPPPKILTAWKNWESMKAVCKRFQLNQNLAFITQSFTFHFCFHKTIQFWFSRKYKNQVCQNATR